ncbi:hypothetical protein GY539_005542, partial [Escherichia coli]|nr:hypothetical protein [Escherichia coli]
MLKENALIIPPVSDVFSPHHPFENLRRKGHHCHDRKRLSGGRPQKFLPA